MNRTQKRLLILGGQLKMCDIVNRARELGVYTVVTDWYQNSPAKALADKAYDVSTSDVDAILQLIREERIDGVFTGYIDSTLPYYYEICRKAGLPCYLNQKILDCCTNKRRFKETCKKVGIRSIPDVSISDLSKITYPILIKPVDNSGSKGITVCCDDTMVPAAYERAMRFSKSKSVITEQFMNCDYICAHYIVQNGNAELALLMDKDMNRIGRRSVPYPAAFVSPSRYHQSFLENADASVKALAKHIGMENGTFLISFFVNGRDYYAVEMSARLTATREYIFIKDAIGVDTLEMHIRHALGTPFESIDAIKKVKSEDSIYCMLFIFLKDGIIGKIEGIEEVRALHGVLDVLQLRDIGARIRADGSYGQLLGRVYLKAGSEADMIKLADAVEERIRVYDENGKSMIVTGFDAFGFFS